MKKNNNKTNVLNTNTGVQHVQIAGVAYYDESKYVCTRLYRQEPSAKFANARCGATDVRRHLRLCGTAKEKASFAAD